MLTFCQSSAAVCCYAEYVQDELLAALPSCKTSALEGLCAEASPRQQKQVKEEEQQQLPPKLERQLIRQKTQDLEKAQRETQEERRHILEEQERLRRQAEDFRRQAEALRRQAEELERIRKENSEQQRCLRQEEQRLQSTKRFEEQQQRAEPRRQQQQPRSAAERCRKTARLSGLLRRVPSMVKKVKDNTAGIFTRGSRHPLHAAVKRANAEAVELLLDAGASRNLKDFHMRTPLELAKMLDKHGSHRRVIAVLSR